MKFSERNGIKSPKVNIQIDYIDDDLRNSLWNVIDIIFLSELKNHENRYYNRTKFKVFYETIWFSFFKEPIDTIPTHKFDLINLLRDRFFYFEWYEIYDFIEFIVKNPQQFEIEEIIKSFNAVLKRDLSGYRFIQTELVPITDEYQIEQIENAIVDTRNAKLKSVNTHLKVSLEKLSDKLNPDFRNSIKESISAVESLVQIIAEDNKAELGKALKVIRDKIGLHGALEQGFKNLYGYTSNGDGIRHAITEEPNIDLEDAIYMLTSCSAFINYLIVKADKAGISLK